MAICPHEDPTVGICSSCARDRDLAIARAQNRKMKSILRKMVAHISAPPTLSDETWVWHRVKLGHVRAGRRAILKGK